MLVYLIASLGLSLLFLFLLVKELIQLKRTIKRQQEKQKHIENKYTSLRTDVRRLMWDLSFQNEKVSDDLLSLIRHVYFGDDEKLIDIRNKLMEKIK